MASPKTFTHKSEATVASGGFTLVEMMVIIGLFMLIAMFAVTNTFDVYRGVSYRSERDMLIALLQRARSQAVNNLCFGASCTDGLSHGVHFEAGKYVVFQSSTYSAADAANEVVIPRSKNVSVVGPDVIFTSLSATATPATITVSDGLTHSSVITISSEGQIKWTN